MTPKPQKVTINYPMLSNYSLGQRARWGDQLAQAEIDRRARENVPEPKDAIEPQMPDSYDPYKQGIDQRNPAGAYKNQLGNVVGKSALSTGLQWN